MASSLFLVPADEESYQATLAQPVDLSECPELPHEVSDRARVWGVRTDPAQGEWTRNKRNWSRMNPGDPLLFYRNSKGRYDAAGRVGAMFETEYVRDRYWDGGPAISVFTVEDWNRDVELDRREVNQILEYKKSFWPQGLWRVTDDRPKTKVLRNAGLE